MNPKLRPARQPLRMLGLGTGAVLRPDGSRVTLRTRKHLALLFILALRRGRSVTRDRLVELLWSEDGEKKARHSLSQSVSLVNKALGAEVIVTAGHDQLAVEPGGLTLDVEEFEDLVASGHREEARALWRGTLLEGLWLRRAPAFEQWIADERGRCERLMRRLATDLMEQCRQRGDHVGMRAEAEALLAMDPLDETAMLACLQALTLCDERTMALRRYTEFEARLKVELAAEPGAPLRAWARRHRKGEAAAPPVPAVSRVHEIQSLPAVQPMFGRVEEYRQLWEAWERAQTGTGSFWIIEGEPGIGKTALVGRLANQVHVSGASVCFVKCYRTEKSVPFAPISALIRQMARLPGFMAMNPSWIGELTRLVPELRDRFPHAPAPLGVDDSARFRLCDAAVHAAACVADEQPLLIVVDDVHDADEATLALLHYLGRQVGAWPAILAVTTRPQSQLGSVEADFISMATRSKVASFAFLGMLPSEVITRLAQQELAKVGLGSDVASVEGLVAGSNGNPLHTIEACASITRTLASSSGSTGHDSGAPKDHFEAAALSRLGQLPLDSVRIAQCLALAGRPLAEHELAEVLVLSPAVLAESLMNLALAEFTRHSGPRVSLAHDQYSVAIKSALPLEELRGLHQQLATLLKKGASNDPATNYQVASHFVSAGLATEGRIHALMAARFAASLGAVREQAAALRLAMASDAAMNPDLTVQLAECLLELGQLQELKALEQESATSNGFPEQHRRSLNFLAIAGDLTFGRTPLAPARQQLTALIESGGAFGHTAQARALLVRVVYRLGDGTAAKRLVRQLRKDRRSDESKLVSATALESAAFIAAKFFSPARALRYLTSALEVASSRHDWALEHQCRAGLGAVYRQLGMFAESEREFTRGLALARRTLNKRAEAARLSDIATVRLGLGDFDTAERLLQEAAAIVRSGSPHTFAFYLSSNLGEVALLMGRYPAAVERFSYAHQEADELGAWSIQLVTAAGLALCGQRIGRIADLDLWGRRVANLSKGRENYLHDRWMIDAARAWHLALCANAPDTALRMLEVSCRELRRRDVDHWLMLRVEAARLALETGRPLARDEIQVLTEEARRHGAGGVLECLGHLTARHGCGLFDSATPPA